MDLAVELGYFARARASMSSSSGFSRPLRHRWRCCAGEARWPMSRSMPRCAARGPRPDAASRRWSRPTRPCLPDRGPHRHRGSEGAEGKLRVGRIGSSTMISAAKVLASKGVVSDKIDFRRDRPAQRPGPCARPRARSTRPPCRSASVARGQDACRGPCPARCLFRRRPGDQQGQCRPMVLAARPDDVAAVVRAILPARLAAA